MQTPLISVVLPAFNAGKYLLPAVRSIQQQSFRNWELILIDDGSTDASIDTIKMCDDDRIRIYSDGVNRGLSARLNEVVSYAKGRYIARMDADDLAFPDRLEKQFQYLETHPDVDLLSSRALVFHSTGYRVLGLLPYRETHADITRNAWRGMYMPHPTWMGRAEWFRRFNYRFPEVVRAEDQELLLRAMPKSRYHSLPDVLLAYRQFDFNYRKTMRARRTLLLAQLEILSSRREWLPLLEAVSITAVKVAADSIASIPGLNFVFFSRMGFHVPDELLMRFEKLKADTGAVDAGQ